MSSKKCLFCDIDAKYYGQGALDTTYNVECPNCYKYTITDILFEYKEDYINEILPQKHLISGLIREKNEYGLNIGIITSDNIENLMSDPLIPKTMMQKLDKILLYYYSNSEKFGQTFDIYPSEPYSIGYAHDSTEYENMIKALIDIGYFTETNSTMQHFSFTISLDGLKRAEELTSTNLYTNKVFVAMEFKDDLIQVHKTAIQPACKECGFDANLVSEVEHNDDITDRIIAEIKTSKFVITDFTCNNHGAYFEAGYAQGRGLNVIRTCNKDWFDGNDENGIKNRLHFDINHYNFILWENAEDLKEKLINRIKATII